MEYKLIKIHNEIDLKKGFENSEMYEFKINSNLVGYALIKNNVNSNNIFIIFYLPFYFGSIKVSATLFFSNKISST